MKKTLVLGLISYTLVLFLLLMTNFKGDLYGRTMTVMGMALFFTWVLLGGFIQVKMLGRARAWLSANRKHPLLWFVSFATLLACLEEAIATFITNLAPWFGSSSAHISASTNYFHVIFFHSVIVFIPMFFVLALLMKRYHLSPFDALIIFGLVGVLAEYLLAGPIVLLNAPFWMLVYGLMVYLPSYQLAQIGKNRLSYTYYPLIIPIIAFSAMATAWIPFLFDTGSHF